MYRIDIPQYTTQQGRLIGDIIDWMEVQGWQEDREYSFSYTRCLWTHQEEVERLCLNLTSTDRLQFHLVWDERIQELWNSEDIIVWDISEYK